MAEALLLPHSKEELRGRVDLPGPLRFGSIAVDVAGVDVSGPVAVGEIEARRRVERRAVTAICVHRLASANDLLGHVSPDFTYEDAEDVAWDAYHSCREVTGMQDSESALLGLVPRRDRQEVAPPTADSADRPSRPTLAELLVICRSAGWGPP